MNQYPLPSTPEFTWGRRLAGALLTASVALSGAACSSGEQQSPAGISAPASASPEQSPPVSPTPEVSASVEAPNPALEGNDDEVLNALGGIEATAGRKIFNGSMQFFAIPRNAGERADAVSWQPDCLRLSEEAGMRPLLIIEPGGFNMNTFSSKPADAYFGSLKDAGVQDSQLGRVVVMPEYLAGADDDNPDVWHHADPADYVANANAMTAALRRHFPNAEPSLMIDMASIEAPVLLKAIQRSPELLNTDGMQALGVQAFANSERITFDQDGRADLSAYLNPKAIASLAEGLGMRKIWLNTGIIKEDKELGVSYTPEQRRAIADATVNVIAELQQEYGITVDTVNLFAQNKLHSEGRDFSFGSEDKNTLVTFAEQLDALGVAISGYGAPAS